MRQPRRIPKTPPAPARPLLRRVEPPEEERITIERLPAPNPARELAAIRAGLLATPRETDPKYFYDDRGSALFEAICTLPEYYPTRTERGLLERLAAPIAALTRAREVVELGAGSARKTRLLLDAVARHAGLQRFVPFDWSAGTMRRVASELVREYDALEVHAVIGDFTSQLAALPAARHERLVVFLGGTIGNFRPPAARDFLAQLASRMQSGEHLLLGTDLVKDPARLVAAYDDAAGLTAEFNRNALRVLNTRLHADFDPQSFAHRAFYDVEAAWIEMRLVSRVRQHVRVGAIDLEIDLDQGEEIRTEISAKYDRPRVEAMLDAAGFALEEWHTDRDSLFALSLARRR